MFGTKDDRDVMRLDTLARPIYGRASWAQSIPDGGFHAETAALKERLLSGEKAADVRIDAFALAREAAFRVLGERPFDVQVMGAIALDEGAVAEMKTGEGKTLVCVMPAYFNSLYGKGVHIITVNEYLAKRDAEWMGAVYRFFGVGRGVICTEMPVDKRREAYA